MAPDDTWSAVMKLRELRIQALLTQKELGEKAGVATVTIAFLERGAQLPSPKTSRKLAAALGVDPKQIDEVQQAVERALNKQRGR